MGQKTDKQWINNTQSGPYAPPNHRFTGGWRGASTSNHPTGTTKPLPSVGSKCKIVKTDLKKGNKYSVVCSTTKKPR
jgi:hypothetical protein